MKKKIAKNVVLIMSGGSGQRFGANKRMFLNIVATYGRILYALAIGVFCGRWTLMASA